MAGSEGVPEVGIPGAFEAFYRSNYAAVVGLMYGLTGSRWVAEDLTQEAFLRAHRDWARVEKMEPPGGWVRRVAFNLARSRWRRIRNEAAARLRSGPEAVVHVEPDPELDAFWEEVRRLPRRQAQVIALHYVEDSSVAEISGTLQLAEGSVKALLYQGRERLRRQLVAKGWVDEV